MRALITGAAGFVGRHMAAELLARGWEVEGFDLRTAPALADGVVCGDVRRIGEFGWVRGVVYDLVVHCAYQVGGRAVIDGVPMALAHNVAADAVLFEWALTTGQRRVLYFSSSAAYPVSQQSAEWAAENHADDLRMHEDDIDLGDAEEPDANYGWAKLTGERLARAAVAEGLPVHVVRPFSGYSGDQGEEYPFPALLGRVLANQGEPVKVWGSAEQVRDWIHIDDVVRGALAVVDADERRPVNLCSGTGTSMESLVYGMWTIVRPGEPFPGVKVLADQPLGVHYRVGDPSRMHEHYTPAVSLADGIRRAVAELRQRAAA